MRTPRQIDTIEDYLAALSPPQVAIVEALRLILGQTLTDPSEWINSWGNPVYSAGSTPIACIMAAGGCVDLGFFKGAQLSSSSLHVPSSGLRYIRLKAVADIDNTQLRELLREAQQLA